jgi:hypothetical protein
VQFVDVAEGRRDLVELRDVVDRLGALDEQRVDLDAFADGKVLLGSDSRVPPV